MITVTQSEALDRNEHWNSSHSTNQLKKSSKTLTKRNIKSQKIGIIRMLVNSSWNRKCLIQKWLKLVVGIFFYKFLSFSFQVFFLNFQLKWTDPDEDGLVAFLCGDRQFNEDRVRNGSKKIMKTRSTSTQGRLDSFFKVIPSATPVKRKGDEIKKESAKKIKSSNTPKRGGRKGK